MRKLVALMLAMVLCFGLTLGCKNKGGSDNAEPAPPDDQIQNTDNAGDGGGESK